MKFLATILTFFLFLSPVTALSAEEVETEETPIVETVEEEPEEIVPGFTDEELDALINEKFLELVDGSLTLVVGAWESFIAVLGVSTFGGILVLVHYMLKRFGLYNGLLRDNEKVIGLLTREIAAERKDIDEMRKTFMALLTMLNIDPRVKTTLIDKLATGLSVDEFAQVAKEIQVDTDTQNIEEVASLLEQVSNVK